jgi:hypothetical protein
LLGLETWNEASSWWDSKAQSLMPSCAALAMRAPSDESARPSMRHLDLESGMASHTIGSMFLVGACACLVVSITRRSMSKVSNLMMIQAAVILSASVTLATLPGMNGIARTADLIAIMCSVLSMIISFISIIRYKADSAHGMPASGSEGFVLLCAFIVTSSRWAYVYASLFSAPECTPVSPACVPSLLRSRLYYGRRHLLIQRSHAQCDCKRGRCHE